VIGGDDPDLMDDVLGRYERHIAEGLSPDAAAVAASAPTTYRVAYQIGLVFAYGIKAAVWIAAVAVAALIAALTLGGATVVVHAAVEVVRASWGLW